MALTSAFINMATNTMNSNFLLILIIGIAVAAAAGNLGRFMVLKRMSLVGDALSHVALPGMAIALTLNISPMIGAFVALIFAVLAIWYLSEKSSVYPETLVGIIFTASLALGILITPQPELLEALFGNIEKISLTEGVIAVVLSILVIATTSFLTNKLMLLIVSEDLAQSVGIKPKHVNLIYLLSIGIIVALGVRFVGTLLTGALVIVPAAAAKNISNKMSSYSFLSTIIGIASAILGIILSQLTGITAGPLVVLSSVFIFILTYLAKKTFQR